VAFLALLAGLIVAVYAPFFAGQVLYNRDIVRWVFQPAGSLGLPSSKVSGRGGIRMWG